MTFKEIYRQDKTRGIIGILSIPAGIFMLATGILSDFSTEGKIFALTGYASLSILGILSILNGIMIMVNIARKAEGKKPL
jgi:hypothetical protein